MLVCFISSSISSAAAILSTGGEYADSLCQDSIKISICNLRKVNAKLIELDYEKQINKNLKSIVLNDSIAIDGLKSRIDIDNRNYNRRTEVLKRERNIASGISITAIILLIISIL